MIINCPRCGFSQPQDQYCAQCGVNMQSFRPAEKPIGTKLAENLGLQVLILVIVATFAGTYMIQSGTSPKWVQKLTRSQGVSKSIKSVSTSATATDALTDYSSNAIESLADLQNKEIIVEESSNSNFASAPNPVSGNEASAATSARSQEAKDSNTDPSAVSFKLTYAEVSVEVLSKWVAESSRLGLFQNLQNYSAGILPDFQKRGDTIQDVLKSHSKKLSLGQIESFLAGTVGDDGQLVGLSTSLELKSNETNAVHGTLVITRASRSSRESFPAEFDLNKGAAFFIVDAITRQNFQSERASLTAQPFQVFKSLDFMAQKTKFVILLEPDLK